MTSFEPVQAGPYLIPSDPPDLANISKAIVDWAALRSNMRFASTTARDATIPSPVEGMECVTGTGAAMIKWLYFNAAWRLLSALNDTGWITATLLTGWTAVAGNLPVYRRMNGITYMAGTATSTGASAAAFTLPVGFRCGLALTQYVDSAATQQRASVTTAGNVGQAVAAVSGGFCFSGLAPFPAV